MIKANELRIGNWVQVKSSPSVILGARGFLKIRDGEDIDDLIEWGSYEPIPLTPEILEQCGFALRHGILTHKYFENNGVELDFSDGYWRRIMVTQFVTYRFNEVKYLHQLQNLYHSLTGEELQVNIHDNIKTES